LGSADLQNSARGNLTSQIDKPPGQSFLQPFSEKLRVDEELKLSRESFIVRSKISSETGISPLSQLTATAAFPTPHVLAQFASKAYADNRTGETDAQYETRLALSDDWKLLMTV